MLQKKINKKKILRAKNSSYVSKALQKAGMKKSYLEKLYFKKRPENSLKTYKTQKQSFVKDYKIFWKIIKPLFSDKGNLRSRINLIEHDDLIHNDNKVAENLHVANNEFSRKSY